MEDKGKSIYESAKKLNPQRFNKSIRNWKEPEIVALNPIVETKSRLISKIIQSSNNFT